jgi:hypothetical protein
MPWPSVDNMPVNVDDYLSNGQRLIQNSSQRDAGTVWIQCLSLLAMGLDAILESTIFRACCALPLL